MNRILYSFNFFLLPCLIVLSIYFIAAEGNNRLPEKFVELNKNKSPKKPDQPDMAVLLEFEKTRDPKTNSVPFEKLLEARAYMESLASDAGPIPGITWNERGPNNVGGRTRAILVDLNDTTYKTVWAGGVAGGLWKSTDITQLDPNWVNADDFYDNLAISCIVQNTLNPQEIYFGTGEGWHNVDAVRGLGIWKSTNGGNSFTHLSSTNNSSFYRVQKMVIHPVTGDVYAATRDNGVMKSTNGGTTWTKVLGDGTGALTNKAADLEIGADNTIYAGMGMVFAPTDGIYKSTSGDAGTWTKLNTSINGFPTTGFNRIEIAAAPSDANTIYCLTQSETTYGIFGIYKTTNQGTLWTQLPNPIDSDPFINEDFTRGQAWYDLIAQVDPNNANVCYVGGIDLFKTVNGGLTWNQISHWYGLAPHQEVHADQHQIVFQPGSSDIIYFGNDGGIYMTSNGSAAVPTIKSKELGYNTTQFYGCAIHPAANTTHFLAGSQDNGSHKFTQAGINSTPEITGGDGAFCNIDKDQPQYQYTQYVYNNYFRSTDGGNSFASVDFNNNGQFINPTDFDDLNNKLYGGNAAGTYFRWDNPHTGSTSSSVSVTNFAGASVTAVRVSPVTANRVFFGLNNGTIVRVDDAHTGTSKTGTVISSGTMPSPAWVSSIALENGNENHMLVSYSNYGVNSVWETTNGGSSWTSVEGNLPDMPIRWVIFAPNNNDQALAATELGVWSTDNLNGISTNWGPSNSGLANVSTHQLQYRTSDNFLIAATHGRGLYSTSHFSPPFADFGAGRRVTYTGKNIQFTDNSSNATSWNWSFGDGGSSNVQNPSHSYSNPGLYTVSLTINGSLSETKTDYITVLPNRGSPYTLTDGGNFEVNPADFANEALSGSSWERGNSTVIGKDGTHSGANAWVTGIADAQYLDNTHSNLYTPSFDFSQAGTYTIKFWGKYSTEATWDGFRVEASTNKGDSWQYIGTVSPTWYNNPNAVLSTVFPAGEPYFSGVEPNYKAYSTDVSSYAGNASVAFRFVFKSDGNTPDIGVAVDDFEIDRVIPVELSSFTASVSGRVISLNWSTATELNASEFIIERNSGDDNWKSVGQVSAKGTTTEQQNYSFIDNKLNKGIYNYRLKTVDFDGTYEYSFSVSAEVGTPKQFALSQNYPNPFNPFTKIDYEIPVDAKVKIELYSISGEKIADLINAELTAGYYTADINAGNLIRGLASGVYIYRIFAEPKAKRDNFVQVKKMIMMK